jgi:uncharacterized protein (DUF342 family)
MQKLVQNKSVEGEFFMEDKTLMNSLDMLNKIYSMREEELGKCSKELQEKLNNVTMEEVQKLIESNIGSNKEKEKVLSDLDKLVENYEIKMANYQEQSYKQGFKDAFELFLECSKK